MASAADLEQPTMVEESLSPGDHVLLYTDGIIEARNDVGELFGRTGWPQLHDADALPVADKTRPIVSLTLAHQYVAWQDDASLLLQWIGK